MNIIKLPKTCVQCGSAYLAKVASQKYCPECRYQRAAGARQQPPYPKATPTGTIGAIAELAVCAELLRLGYAVFRAVSPACYCDLLAVGSDGCVRHIEVRSGSRLGGKVYYAPLSKRRHPSLEVVVYVHSTNELVFIERR